MVVLHICISHGDKVVIYEESSTNFEFVLLSRVILYLAAVCMYVTGLRWLLPGI